MYFGDKKIHNYSFTEKCQKRFVANLFMNENITLEDKKV